MIKCLHHVRITDFRTIHIILEIIENTNTWNLYSERCVKIIRNTLSSISTMCRLQIAEELSQLLPMWSTAAVSSYMLFFYSENNKKIQILVFWVIWQNQLKRCPFFVSVFTFSRHNCILQVHISHQNSCLAKLSQRREVIKSVRHQSWGALPGSSFWEL